MSKIHILVDSSADLTLEEAEKNDVRILPFRLNFDGEEYHDRIDIDTKEFYKKAREVKTVPKTVQITPAEFEDIFREEAEKGYDEIVVVTIASTASGTFQSATIAKDAVEDIIKVHLVDSMHLAFGTGNAVIKGAELLKNGGSAAEVADRIREVLSCTDTYFVVETLEYLKKGGRIKTATAVIGGVLDIRPILRVVNGCVEAVDKVRGEKKVIPKFLSILKEKTAESADCSIYILSGDADRMAEELAKAVKDASGITSVYHDVGSIIGSHAGPGVLGIVFVSKKF